MVLLFVSLWSMNLSPMSSASPSSLMSDKRYSPISATLPAYCVIGTGPRRYPLACRTETSYHHDTTITITDPNCRMRQSKHSLSCGWESAKFIPFKTAKTIDDVAWQTWALPDKHMCWLLGQDHETIIPRVYKFCNRGKTYASSSFPSKFYVRFLFIR